MLIQRKVLTPAHMRIKNGSILWFHPQSAAPGRDKGDGECNDDKEYKGVWLERGSCLCRENTCAATACGKHREMGSKKVFSCIYGRLLYHVRTVRRPG